MSMQAEVLVLDFGSQYTQLIARRIRELGVYCQIAPYRIGADEVAKLHPKALVLSGGPASVCEEGSPTIDRGILELAVPVLGICYGMQLLAHLLGGKIERQDNPEYGPAVLEIDCPTDIFAGLDGPLDVWMSHGDWIGKVPQDFKAIAHTIDCRVVAMANEKKRIYGVQFHPEVAHTPRGKEILHNFLFRVAGCSGGWAMANFIEDSVSQIKAQVGDERVICGLSGGVDSSVTAALLTKAIGDRVVAVFVDNGVLRAGEVKWIRRAFQEQYPLNLRFVDARTTFLDVLKGITDPEEKRKAIGKTFIDVFQKEAKEIGNVRFLAQGTLYPDVIESCSVHGGPSVTIKSHHNVGGLPEELGFELIEPLKSLFKDEVRQLGIELGLPEQLVHRQPFPGPGLAVRIIGEVTEESLKILRQADTVVQEEMERLPDYRDIWQSFAVLLPVKTVGVMGDERTYANVVALRVVTSLDGMTADWSRLPHDVLERVSTRIINEVPGVNRVVYDISSKPPSTIEWE